MLGTQYDSVTATDKLYAAWQADSGASPGCGRILFALDTAHRSSSKIHLEDLFRLDPNNLNAALTLLQLRLRGRIHELPLENEERKELHAEFCRNS